MYYKEKLINGVLMFQSKPNGEWRQCSIEKMSTRIIELEKENNRLKKDIKDWENDCLV